MIFDYLRYFNGYIYSLIIFALNISCFVLQSGCILAVLGSVCVANPDARLSILFLPFFSFSASKVFQAFTCFNSFLRGAQASIGNLPVQSV